MVIVIDSNINIINITDINYVFIFMIIINIVNSCLVFLIISKQGRKTKRQRDH